MTLQASRHNFCSAYPDHLADRIQGGNRVGALDKETDKETNATSGVGPGRNLHRKKTCLAILDPPYVIKLQISPQLQTRGRLIEDSPDQVFSRSIRSRSVSGTHETWKPAGNLAVGSLPIAYSRLLPDFAA